MARGRGLPSFPVLLFTRTPASLEFVSSVHGKDQMLASIVVRRRFDVRGGTLQLAEAQDWSIAEPPIDAEVWGTFDPESPQAREGTDVFVLGRVYPEAPGATRGSFVMDIDGEPFTRIDAYGRRTWKRERRTWVASAPEALEPTPLSWFQAFGGAFETEVGAFPCPANPKGRGFVPEGEDPEGVELPCLEDPAEPLTDPFAAPRPIALGPLGRESSLRALEGVELDESGDFPAIAGINQRYFNSAEPRFVRRPAAAEGTRFELRGARPDGAAFDFALPAIDLHAHVQRGERGYVLPFHTDLVVVLPDEQQVVVGQRCTITYPFVAEERRAATVYAGAVPADGVERYHIDWNAYDEEERRHA